MTASPPVDDGGATHLAAGLQLPDLSLASTRGGMSSPVRPGLCVIYIYPWTGRPGHPNPLNWDDIPGAHGSTPQAEGFRDHYAEFAARKFGVIGLSGQTPSEQREFSTRLGLPFELLSDAGFAFADALRLPRFATGGISYLKRLTLIVRDGILVEAIYPVTRPAQHAGEVLAQIQPI